MCMGQAFGPQVCLAPLILVAVILTTGEVRADVFTWDTTPISTDWNNPFNWFGTANQVPDGDLDSAVVSGSASLDPTLTSNRTLGALSISAGGDVFTGNGTSTFRLIVQDNGGLSGTTLIEGLSSTLSVHNTAFALDAETDNLTVRTFGRLTLSGGPFYEVNNALDIDDDGEISGFGTINVAGSTNAVNDGLIRASGGLLRISATGAAALDIDGVNENGRYVVNDNSTLILDIPFIGPIFDGTITINENASLGMTHNWTLNGSIGTAIDLNGGSGIATIGGAGAVTVAGRININSGTADFAANTLVQSSGLIVLAGNTTLQFDAPTTIQEPESINNAVGVGGSTFIVNQTVFVGSGGGFFDWDNSGGGDGTTIVNPNGELNIDVTAIDAMSDTEQYNGTIIMNSGDIDVQNGDGVWEMLGSLQLINTAADEPELTGEEVVFRGAVSAAGTGTSRIATRTAFESTSSVNVANGAFLSLDGSVCLIRGGTWTGAGVVNLDNSSTTFQFATTVNMPAGTMDLDGAAIGSDQLAINSETTLNVASIDDENGAFDETMQMGSSGRLTVNLTNPAAFWTMGGTMFLNGPGGVLATTHLGGSPLHLTGTTQVTGNSISTARLTFAGATNLGPNGSLALRSGTEASPNVVESSASFTGSGDLVVSSVGGPAYLRLNDNAAVAVGVSNFGHFEVGSSTGSAEVASFTQSPSATYEAEVESLVPSTGYDVLRVTGLAQLDGTLEVLVNANGGSYSDPALPGTFDEFGLMFASSIVGRFDLLSYDGGSMTLYGTTATMDRFHAGGGLFRILQYEATEFDLLNYRAISGDANGDGSVDGSDFGIWNANKFSSGTDWTTGDFNGDGMTDGTDFGIWNANKFTSIPLGRPVISTTRVVPEPSSALVMLLGVLSAVRGSLHFRPSRTVVLQGSA